MPPGGMDGGGVFKDRFNWTDTYIKYQINSSMCVQVSSGVLPEDRSAISTDEGVIQRTDKNMRGAFVCLTTIHIRSCHITEVNLVPRIFFPSLQADVPSDCAKPQIVSACHSCHIYRAARLDGNFAMRVNEHLFKDTKSGIWHTPAVVDESCIRRDSFQKC